MMDSIVFIIAVLFLLSIASMVVSVSYMKDDMWKSYSKLFRFDIKVVFATSVSLFIMCSIFLMFH